VTATATSPRESALSGSRSFQDLREDPTLRESRRQDARQERESRSMSITSRAITTTPRAGAFAEARDQAGPLLTAAGDRHRSDSRVPDGRPASGSRGGSDPL